MPMTAFNSPPLPISKPIWWARRVSTQRYLQPLRLGPGIAVWPACLKNGVARAG
jgi:hypothetical protein